LHLQRLDDLLNRVEPKRVLVDENGGFVWKG
jgi:hypothetical protein